MSNRRLFWNIVDKIEQAINLGDFPEKSRLPAERELAERYQVSRPTIREAIIALEVRGRVEVKTGSGVYVLPSQSKTGAESMNAFEVTQARALIEGEIAAIAATTIHAEELEALKETLIAMESSNDIEQADEEFHQIIAAATRNNAIIYSFENLWRLRSATIEIINDHHMVCSSDNVKTLAEHTAIYEALKSGNAAAARTAMHKHFNRLINVLFEAEEARALEEIRKKNSLKRDLYSLENILKSNRELS